MAYRTLEKVGADIKSKLNMIKELVTKDQLPLTPTQIDLIAKLLAPSVHKDINDAYNSGGVNEQWEQHTKQESTNMRFLCRFGIHPWRPWGEPFEQAYTLLQFGVSVGEGVENRQRRTCYECGKAQERIVR